MSHHRTLDRIVSGDGSGGGNGGDVGGGDGCLAVLHCAHYTLFDDTLRNYDDKQN